MTAGAGHAGLDRFSDQDMLAAMRSSCYPGLDDDVLYLILNYCRLSGLNPMLKPVHAMKVNVQVSKNPPEYADRWVVMPGIGHYRTQASRTGEFAGSSVPEFGPAVTGSWSDDKGKVHDVTFPEHCTVTVRRILPSGHVAEHHAREFWVENYATVSRFSDCPNSMWRRRPFAMLAKCAEAQALRHAFPELLGAQHTAEEHSPHAEANNDVQLLEGNGAGADPELAAALAALRERNAAEAAAEVVEPEPVSVSAGDSLRAWQDRIEQGFHTVADANRLLDELRAAKVAPDAAALIRAQVQKKVQTMVAQQQKENSQ